MPSSVAWLARRARCTDQAVTQNPPPLLMKRRLATLCPSHDESVPLPRGVGLRDAVEEVSIDGK